jgi:hypothetical protein
MTYPNPSYDPGTADEGFARIRHSKIKVTTRNLQDADCTVDLSGDVNVKFFPESDLVVRRRTCWQER